MPQSVVENFDRILLVVAKFVQVSQTIAVAALRHRISRPSLHLATQSVQTKKVDWRGIAAVRANDLDQHLVTAPIVDALFVWEQHPPEWALVLQVDHEAASVPHRPLRDPAHFSVFDRIAHISIV